MARTLYQIVTQVVLPPNLTPETVTESRWHQPWSEPVRAKQGLRAHLQQFYTVDTLAFSDKNEPTWYQWLSEPVRFKRGPGAHLQRFEIPFIPTTYDPSKSNPWFSWLSEPVRIRPQLRTGDQAFFFFEPEPPESMEIEWYAWLSEPVRQKRGLKPPYQQFLAYHPRILPNPNVTARMATTELNSDVFLGALYVYTGSTTVIAGQGAQVSIEEIQIPGNSPVSNKGN